MPMLRPRTILSVAAAGLLLGAAAWRGPAPAADSAGLGVPASRSAASSAVAASRQGPFAVVIVIDAARADEVNLSQMPNLAQLVQRGTTYPNAWVGQLPSITESSHATIGTGVYPRRHLILGDTWRIPGTSQMSPNLLNSNLTRTGYIGRLIQQSGSPSIANFVHQKYPGSLVVSLSGHKIYAADGMGAGSADFVAFGTKDAQGRFVAAAIPGHAPAQSMLTNPQLILPTYPRDPGLEDHWTTTLAEKFLFKYHPRVMMINYPEVDTTGHLVGTDATVMQPLMSKVDTEIGRLVAAYQRSGLLNQTYWFVLSDHGMVPAVHTVDETNVKAIVENAGGQPLYIGHGDYSTVWLKNLDAVPRVAQALADAAIPDVDAVFARTPSGPYRLVSSAKRLANASVVITYKALLSTYNEGEAPDIVLMYDENTITMTPNFVKIGRKGDHEGASWGAQHIPLVIAGPGIRPGYTSAFPARLVDIAPSVETYLKITPQNQDGVPLADAMTNPPDWALKAQDSVNSSLSKLQGALASEARSRPNS